MGAAEIGEEVEIFLFCSFSCRKRTRVSASAVGAQVNIFSVSCILSNSLNSQRSIYLVPESYYCHLFYKKCLVEDWCCSLDDQEGCVHALALVVRATTGLKSGG
jgi:hypothetical protein